MGSIKSRAGTKASAVFLASSKIIFKRSVPFPIGSRVFLSGMQCVIAETLTIHIRVFPWCSGILQNHVEIFHRPHLSSLP